MVVIRENDAAGERWGGIAGMGRATGVGGGGLAHLWISSDDGSWIARAVGGNSVVERRVWG